MGAAGRPRATRSGEAARAHALDALRHSILSGDVAPGQRLVEEELAGTLGVTRQSLRAALLELTAQGLVERIPNRGARVRVVSTEEAVAITECRMALESLCAAKAAELITDDEAAQFCQLGENLQRAVAEANPEKYSELNRELHRRVVEISGQRVASGLLERLHGQLVRHQFQLALRPGRRPATPSRRSGSTWPASSRHSGPARAPRIRNNQHQYRSSGEPPCSPG
jgi:DNA-binding GntR family transcriptional regulator